MSEIKTDKLTGTSTAGSILVTGEGNSTTTNLQQGLAKAWANVTNATPTINDSFNIASITDNGTGDHTLNFTNAMGNANYAYPADVKYNATSTAVFSAGGVDSSSINQATSGVRINTIYVTPSSSRTDYDSNMQFYVVVHGDLA